MVEICLGAIGVAVLLGFNAYLAKTWRVKIPPGWRMTVTGPGNKPIIFG